VHVNAQRFIEARLTAAGLRVGGCRVGALCRIDRVRLALCTLVVARARNLGGIGGTHIMGAGVGGVRVHS